MVVDPCLNLPEVKFKCGFCKEMAHKTATQLAPCTHHFTTQRAITLDRTPSRSEEIRQTSIMASFSLVWIQGQYIWKRQLTVQRLSSCKFFADSVPYEVNRRWWWQIMVHNSSALRKSSVKWWVDWINCRFRSFVPRKACTGSLRHSLPPSKWLCRSAG